MDVFHCQFKPPNYKLGSRKTIYRTFVKQICSKLQFQAYIPYIIINITTMLLLVFVWSTVISILKVVSNPVIIIYYQLLFCVFVESELWASVKSENP